MKKEKVEVVVAKEERFVVTELDDEDLNDVAGGYAAFDDSDGQVNLNCGCENCSCPDGC